MKAKLIKSDVQYRLHNEEGIVIATSFKNGKLSKENCDEIFRVLDVETLSDEYSHDLIWFNKRGACNDQEFFEFIAKKSFTEGFNKAMELNKDKVFTLEDMYDAVMLGVAYEDCGIQGVNSYNELKDLAIERALKPKEIEVEIKLICPHPSDTYVCGMEYGCDADGCNHPEQIPYLDKNGRLILKRI